MNRFMQEQWSIFEALNDLRMDVLNRLTDKDLTYNPGGTNVTLGEVLRDSGDIEVMYIQSLKTFEQDWTKPYRHTEPNIETELSKLKAWYTALDTDFKHTVEAFTNDDLQKLVNRGGYQMPVEWQIQAYSQALFIFLGKMVVYMRALEKPLSPKMVEWIG